MQQKENIDKSAWITLIVLSLVWGCSFILIKKSLVAFGPMQLACLRISISSLAFTPVVLWYWKEIDWKRWYKFLLVGISGSGLPAFLFFIAQTEISSSVSGLLNSLTPIWTLLIGIVVFKIPFNKMKAIGVLLGFVGAASLIILSKHSPSDGNQWYGLFIVAGTICYGTNVNMVQSFFKGIKPIIISSTSFFLIGPPAIVYLLLSDFTTTLATNDKALYSLGAVAILSLLGTVMSTVLFYNLVQKTSAVFGSTVTYLMPIVALAWGALDGESISIFHFFGMALILFGVYISKR